MFSWEDEIISTTKNRLFLVKCNLCWHNCEIFTVKLKKVKLYFQQGRENRKLCQHEQIILNNKAHICWRYKYVLTIKNTYWEMFCKWRCSTKICYALHCYIPAIKILEIYLSRASILLDLQGKKLQLYEIRGLPRTPTSKGALTKSFCCA